MSDRDRLQNEAKPFGPPPDPSAARMFNMVPAEVDGYLPPLETVRERKEHDHRGLQGKQLQMFWDEAFSEDLTLAEMYPHRIKAAWRIVREWAALIGIVRIPGESLRDACSFSPSPWTNRKLVFGERTPPDVRIQNIITDAAGLPFLPPAPPETAKGHPDYTPMRDAKLKKWCALVEYIGTTRLALGHTIQGRYGLAGLTDPNFARLAMPSPAEICAFEDLLVRQTLDFLVAKSRTKAATALREKYGLFDHEIDQIVMLAQKRAAKHAPDDREAVRGLLMLRLEKILDDCDERMDARGALLTLREMSKIAGLDKVEGNDLDATDMANEARLTAGPGKSKKELPPPPPV